MMAVPAALLSCVVSSDAAPPSPATAAEWAAFTGRHCAACHDATTPSGGLDLTALATDLADPAAFARWVTIHDRVRRGEMPPADADRPPPGETQRFLAGLDAALLRADAARVAETGRVRLRRLTRREFENTLVDLLALPRLDITGLLPADGRVAGYDKVAAGLDISPAHLDAYAQAIELALDAAIATRSTPPPVFRRRIHPAGLFKFEMNLVEGQFVLLANRQPDPALPVRGGFEDRQGHVGAEGPDLEERRALYQTVKAAGCTSAVGLLNPNLAGYEAALNVAPIHAGHYRLRISLWGFRWAGGRPEPCAAPQAAALRAHAEGKQQEGGRLLRVLTAPSLESREEEFVAWLDPLESLVFDPVSIPWNGLRIGQVAGRAARHVGPGVALDWFEIEGPLNVTWPPESHRRLFGTLPIAAWPAEGAALPPRRVPVRGLGGYLPNIHTDIPAADRAPPLESVRSDRPADDARRLLAGFLPRAFRRDVDPSELEPYLALLESRLAARDCFEDAMRRVYVAVLTSPEFLFLPAEPPRADAFALAARLSYWLWNGPPDDTLLAAARDGSLLRSDVIGREVDRLLADPRSHRFIDDFTDQWLEIAREAFDPVGGLRQRYRSTGQGLPPPERDRVDWRVTYTLGPEVDASGTLADGRAFAGPQELVDLLAADPGRLAEAFVAHLTRYATGADVGYADRAEIRRIVAATRDRDHGLRSLVHGLARSRLLGVAPATDTRGDAP